MSLNKPIIWVSKLFESGKYGTIENRNSIAAGNAITKLKEMAAALSASPTLFTCLINSTITSNKVSPKLPSIVAFLLFETKKAIGGKLSMAFSNFVTALLFVFWRDIHLMPVGIALRIGYVLQNCY